MQVFFFNINFCFLFFLFIFLSICVIQQPFSLFFLFFFFFQVLFYQMVSLPPDLVFVKYNKNQQLIQLTNSQQQQQQRNDTSYVDSNKLFSYNGTHRQKYIPESMTILIISAVTDKASNLSYLIMSDVQFSCYIYFLIILFNRKSNDSFKQ